MSLIPLSVSHPSETPDTHGFGMQLQGPFGIVLKVPLRKSWCLSPAAS